MMSVVRQLFSAIGVDALYLHAAERARYSCGTGCELVGMTVSDTSLGGDEVVAITRRPAVDR